MICQQLRKRSCFFYARASNVPALSEPLPCQPAVPTCFAQCAAVHKTGPKPGREVVGMRDAQSTVHQSFSKVSCLPCHAGYSRSSLSISLLVVTPSRVPVTKTAQNVDGRCLKCSAGHKSAPKCGREESEVQCWSQISPETWTGWGRSAVLKIVDAYRYYYVIIRRFFYLCVIYCA